MKKFIKLFCRKNLAPQGAPDAAGGATADNPAPNAGKNSLDSGEDSRQQPSGMTDGGASVGTVGGHSVGTVEGKPAADPAPDATPAPAADPAPADNPPAPWEVRVPEEYKKAFEPILAKYQQMGLTAAQAQTFVDEGIRASKESDAKIDAEILSVKHKWGAQFDERQQAAVNTMARLGFTTEQAAAMVGQIGLAAVLERFYEISKKMTPGELKDGEALADIAVMDAAAANQEIERLTLDREFGDRLAAGDAAAKERWERLKRIRRGEK